MTQVSSTFGTYRRLFTTFARPYVWRLVLGVLAGMIAGGSVAGALVVMPSVLRILQGQQSPDEVLSTVTKDKDGLSSLRQLADALGVPLQSEDGRITVYLVVLVVTVMLAFFLFQAVGQYINRYMLRWVGARVVTDIRTRLFRHLQDQSLAFYGREDVGKLISRCTYDTSTVEHAIAHTFADLVQAPVEVIAPLVVVIVLTAGNGLLGMMLLVLLCFPLCVLPVVYLGRRLKHYAVRVLGEVSVLVSRMQETFTGIRVVKAFHMEEYESERFERESEGYFRMVIRALRAEMLMTPLMQFVAISIACVFVVLCYLRSVEFAILGTVGLAAMQAYRPVKLLAKINVQLQRCAAATDRIFELLDADTSLPVSPNPVVLSGISDRIVFEHVNFSYETEGLRILEDIDFEIPRGSVIAFVGETGSGKSTIANLVARFYDPIEGRVMVDGHDLRDVDMESLRRLIGVVTQETILFNDTVGNNIRYGRLGASMEEVIEAAKQANAHDFIMEEPEGYDRMVGEKGCRLSGGQRQRVAIARAILKNPPILILDEATSALDTATEQLVQEAINHVMADRTVFAIAHRLSTIKHANQILVLDRGRVIERGTHDELLARDGRYRKLCEMQFS
jgi:subfamily B ATP-binding cassette protein MsbA